MSLSLFTVLSAGSDNVVLRGDRVSSVISPALPALLSKLQQDFDPTVLVDLSPSSHPYPTDASLNYHLTPFYHTCTSHILTDHLIAMDEGVMVYVLKQGVLALLA